MFHTPYTDGDGDDADEDERYEHQDPHVARGGQLVAHEQLKHQQD